MRSFLSAAVLALVALGTSDAFAPSPMTSARQNLSVLEMSNNNDNSNGAKGLASAALASACIMSSLFSADAAFAEPVSPDFSGSTSMTLAGRASGGRAGGRAASGGASRSASSYRPSSSSNSNTVIRKTTVIQQPPSVIVAPPPMSYGYGYSTGPGFGTIATLGALDAIGDAMREGRQNAEIRNTREQLQQEKMKEFELEQRLKMIEMQQMQQQGAAAQQMQMQQMQMAKPMMQP